MPDEFCEGCGIKLQTEISKQVGFIPKGSLEKGQYICQRCYRIKHYNEVIPIEVDESSFLQILNGISYTDCLVVHIIDVFDIEGTIIHGLPRFIGKNPFILVANKIDLFSKSTNHEKIKQWLSQFMKGQGLLPEKIFLASADKNFYIEEIINYINKKHKKKDVYVIGATNVGKSTFINRLINIVHEKDDVKLTTSRYPGTTLNIVKIPLNDNHFIIDTPGIIHRNRYSEYVSPKTLKEITPNALIKPIVYQLHGKQTLFFGGLARIDQLKDSKNSFVCYISNEILIHRTKLSNADQMYEKHLGGNLAPPTKEEVDTLPELKKHTFNFLGKNKIDIVISGLGWVTVDGEPTDIDVYVPKGIGVHIRKALI